MKRELGSLAGHRAFLGLPPKKGAVAPFPCSPAKVFAAQVAGLVGKNEEEVSSFLSGSFMKSAVMQYFGICHRHGMTDEEIVKHISKLFAEENAKKE